MLTINEYIDSTTYDDLLKAKAKAHMEVYAERWDSEVDDWHVLSVEKEFEVPIIDLETGAEYGDGFTLCGRFDVLAERDGKLLIPEHKTTAAEIHEHDSAYWSRMPINVQVRNYIYALAVQGKSADVLYDVIRKPKISPRNLTSPETTELLELGLYCGKQFGKKYAARETPELFQARLSSLLSERKLTHYCRKVITQSHEELVAHSKGLFALCDRLKQNEGRGKDAHFQNPHACRVGSGCQFLKVCEGAATLNTISGRWYKDEREGLGRRLSSSRMETYFRCEREHYHKYIEGYRGTGRLSFLDFGSLIHECLELYWSQNGCNER